MGSVRAQIAVLLIGYGFLCVFVDRGQAQGGQDYGQNQGQRQGPQNMGTSANDQDYPDDYGGSAEGAQTNNTPNLWYPGGQLNPMPLYNGQTLLLQRDPCLRFRENFRYINIQRRQRCRIAAMRMNNQTIRNTQVCPRIVNGQCVPFTNGTHGACHAIVRHGKKAYTFVLLADCLLNGNNGTNAGGNNGTNAGGNNGTAAYGAGGQPPQATAQPPPTAGG